MADFYVYFCAGDRPMSQVDKRPEYIGRLEWLNLPEVKLAKQYGIKPGVMLIGVERYSEDFDPIELGCRYCIHAPKEFLTNLYLAEIKNDQIAQEKLWQMIQRYASLDPPPSHVTFHLGGTDITPEVLDEHRFNVIADPKAILKNIFWLKKTFRKIVKILPMAAVENCPIVQYVGLPRYNYGGEWVPITYNEDRRGVWLDTGYILEGTSGLQVFDFGHGYFTQLFLSGDGLEYKNLDFPSFKKLTPDETLLFNITGIVYKRGYPPYIPFPFELDTMITRFAPKIIHVERLNPPIYKISNTEAVNPYHNHLKNVLPQDLWRRVRNLRIGSHFPIVSNDTRLLKAVKKAMLLGAEIAVLEVAYRGEGAPKDGSSPGCWWDIDPDAMRVSFVNFIEMAIKLRKEIGL